LAEESIFLTGYNKENLQISKEHEILGWKQNSKRKELTKGDYVFVYDIDDKKIDCLFQINSRIEANDLLWKDELEANSIKYKNRWKANLILDNLNIDKNEILSIFPFNTNPNRFFLFIKNPFPNFLDENFNEFRSFLLSKYKTHDLLKSKKKSQININDQNTQIQYFLVQVNELGSKNILNNNFYEHPNWNQTPRDKDHGLVQSGDLLVVYFASKSIQYKKQLKKIYRVINVSENQVNFQLSEEMELNGLDLNTIKQAIKTGELLNIFNKISQQGFNIIKIDKSDYDSIIFLDKINMEKSKEPALWIVRAGDTGQGEQSALENNCVSIGYDGLPGLHFIKDVKKFKEHYMKTHPNESSGRVGKVVPQIWNFIFEIKIGDFIILPLKTHKSKLISVGKVVGEYQYENMNSEIRQFRPVKWLKKDVNINEFDKDIVKLFDEHGTVYRIGGLTEINQLKEMLKRLGVKEIDLEEMNNISTKSIQLENNENKKPLSLSLEDISKITYFPIKILKEIEDLLIEKKQIIFYGCPGTSKTFLAKIFA